MRNRGNRTDRTNKTNRTNRSRNRTDRSGERPRSYRLKNGVRIITSPVKGTDTATVLVMVGTGSRYESREINGISHFLEHLFFKGTRRRPNALALTSELDSLGAEYNAFTGKEYTGYWIKVAAEKIGRATEIVSDMLINPLFPPAEIEREKGVIIEELNMYRDNPMFYIEDIFEELLYGDTPAGWDTIGTRENILRFKRPDLVEYLEAQYGAGNIFVCLAGKVKKGKGEIQRSGNVGQYIVSRYFGGRKLAARGEKFKEKEKVVEKQARPAVKIHYKKTDQAHLSLGVRAFGYGHPDKLALKLLAVILGGSMSSRMFISLRERAGLAYYVRTETEIYSDSGYLTTRAGVPVDKIEQAIKIILAEYRRVKKELVPAGELRRAKDMLAGRMLIQLEASDAQANWYGRQAVMAATVERETGQAPAILTPSEYLARIKRVTARDLRRVAEEIFSNRALNLAVIGPYREKKRFLDLLSV